MALPNLGSFPSPAISNVPDDPNKKIRKPYTITKSRESWTEPEHDKFLEALHLFDRDWKKIEAFVGSKTVIQRCQVLGREGGLDPDVFQLSEDGSYLVGAARVQVDWIGVPWRSFDTIVYGSRVRLRRGCPNEGLDLRGSYSRATMVQIRSHAQKYFLKVQKSGTNEHLPPPRPKRKAVHPYPQKASKTAPAVTQAISAFHASPAVPDPGFGRRPDSSPLFWHPGAAALNHNRTDNSVHTTSLSHATRDGVKFVAQSVPSNYYCSSNESTPRTRPTVLPDFVQVYSFIGSVFDPNVKDQLQKLKRLDPIDIETVLLLMRNLSINLASPDFQDHRRLLSSYEIGSEKDSASDVIDHILGSESEDAT